MRDFAKHRGLPTAMMMLAAALVPSAAQAQASCDWYAKTALEQQKVNLDRKCGFKGESWSTDLSSHMNWCRDVPPDRWKQQAQLRDQQLAKCASGK